MKKQTLVELCKLYPKIKIPFLDEAQYYLDLQQLNDPKVKKIIQMAEDCEVFVETFDITKYKYAESEKIINYFKENGYLDRLNAVELIKLEGKQYPGSIGNHDPKKFYLSVDIKEANWSMFKKFASMKENDWSEFVTSKFDLHPFLANSKQFRQIIFGNLNPSRIASLQKRSISEIAENCFSGKIVMLTTDEVVYELEDEIDLSNLSQYYYNDLTLNMKQYKMQQVTSHNDTFYIQTTFNEDGTRNISLKNVPGNRYFIHYKEQILNMPVSDNDLLFEAAPKQHAKWIL